MATLDVLGSTNFRGCSINKCADGGLTVNESSYNRSDILRLRLVLCTMQIEVSITMKFYEVLLELCLDVDRVPPSLSWQPLQKAFFQMFDSFLATVQAMGNKLRYEQDTKGGQPSKGGVHGSRAAKPPLPNVVLGGEGEMEDLEMLLSRKLMRVVSDVMRRR